MNRCSSIDGKCSLVMVNYLNAIPFIKGMEADGLFEEMNIRTETPASCAAAFEEGDADVALIPTGALHGINGYTIITDYCIGCDGEVRTVCIFSHQDIRDCRRLLLDNHSRTSVLLARLIVEQYLGLHMPFEPLDIDQYVPEEGDAVLMIGDKVFEHETNFGYKYDLGALWKDWTGLPFVFAVWVARDGVTSEVENRLNHAFRKGVSMIDLTPMETPSVPDLASYFKLHIKYDLDHLKREALHRYLKLSKPYHEQLLARAE